MRILQASHGVVTTHPREEANVLASRTRNTRYSSAATGPAQRGRGVRGGGDATVLDCTGTAHTMGGKGRGALQWPVLLNNEWETVVDGHLIADPMKCGDDAEGGGGGGTDALEGEGPRRRPQGRFDRRLEEVAKAVGGGYCRLQMPLKPALAVRETVAGRRLGAMEGGGGDPPPSNASQGGGAPQKLKEYAWEGGGWHDARLCCCLQLTVSIGLSPLIAALPLNPVPPQAAVPIVAGGGGGVTVLLQC